MSESLDRDGVMAVLPHRHPFLLVDSVHDLVPGERAVGVKQVTAEEPWAPGHFPGNPVMPGVLIAEALAQVAGVIALTANPEYAGQAVYLLGFDKIRFRKPVRPGDQLELSVTVTSRRRTMWFFEGTATVGGERVADGTFLATVAAKVA
jgi:3-hydroxyacyl-[acyl-carrier-protein] dehydratase